MRPPQVVAVKVIKNHPAYHHQARCELAILQLLNTRADPDDTCHIVRLRDSFLHARHLCLVFEALQLNLYELLKQNNFRGLSTPLIRLFLTQLLTALGALRRAGIIHCDLKPENVLLVSLASGALKLIDFGSACAEGRTVYSYIQSRFYRAPEVVLGVPYGASIDMWSLGCVAAELFLGLPLFPGASEYNLMQRVTEALGPPPDTLLASAKNAGRFFKREGGGWALLSVAEHEALTGKAPALGKRYFAATTLPELIHGAPFRRGMAEADVARERVARTALLDWLQGVMALDPAARWTPAQAAAHPFISGAPWEGPWRPAPDPPRPPLPPPSPSAQASSLFGSSPVPSPRSAPVWPGGALPVGLPHSPQTPRGVAIPLPPGAPGAAPSSFSGSAGAPGDYFAAAALGLSSPGQYQALLMQQAAAQQRAAAAAAASRYGLTLGAGVPSMPFGFSPPQSAAIPFAPAMPFSAPTSGWHHPAGFDPNVAAAAAAAGRAAAVAAGPGAGLPPARRSSSGSRELIAAAAAYNASAGAAAGAGAGASPRTSRGGQPRGVRRRSSEGGASLGRHSSADAMDVDRPRRDSGGSPPVPNPADWDPAYSDDALLAGDGDGASAAAQAQAHAQARAQQVAALAQAHAQAHVLQIAQAHAWQLQQQYGAGQQFGAWPGLAPQPPLSGSYSGAAAAGPGLAAWGAQHGAFGAPPPPGSSGLPRRESWSAGTRPPSSAP